MVGTTTADEIIAYKDAIISSWVIEFDGSSETINERMKELPTKDYTQVIDFVRELNEDEEKKTK